MALSEKGYGVHISKIISYDLPELPSKLKPYNFCDFYVYPGLPFEYDNLLTLRNFRGIPYDHLPNYITFEYQFADIAECTDSRKDKIVKLRFLRDYSPIEKGDIVQVTLEKAKDYINNGLAEITKNSISSVEESGPFYYSKSFCKKWEFIDDKKFTKTINLRAYKNSKEMKKLRTKYKRSAGSYYGLRTIYQFKDNGEIILNLENYTTNPWK